MFKPGDKVRISEYSSYYKSQGHNGEGVIVSNNCGWWSVYFTNGYKNNYQDRDLIHVSAWEAPPQIESCCGQPLSKVNGIIGITAECLVCGSLLAENNTILKNEVAA